MNLIVDLSLLVSRYRYILSGRSREVRGLGLFLSRVYEDVDKIYFIGDGRPVRQAMVFSEYKLNREFSDSSVILSSRRAIRLFLYLDKVYFVYSSDMEADETAKYFISEYVSMSGEEWLLLSSDFDWYQLLEYRNVYLFEKESDILEYLRYGVSRGLWDYNRVYRDRGVYPDSIALYKAFRGDGSDNVKPLKINDLDAKLLSNEFKNFSNLSFWVNCNDEGFSFKYRDVLLGMMGDVEWRYSLFKLDPEYVPDIFNKVVSKGEALSRLQFLEHDLYLRLSMYD